MVKVVTLGICGSGYGESVASEIFSSYITEVVHWDIFTAEVEAFLHLRYKIDEDEDDPAESKFRKGLFDDRIVVRTIFILSKDSDRTLSTILSSEDVEILYEKTIKIKELGPFIFLMYKVKEGCEDPYIKTTIGAIV